MFGCVCKKEMASFNIRKPGNASFILFILWCMINGKLGYRSRAQTEALVHKQRERRSETHSTQTGFI